MTDLRKIEVSIVMVHADEPMKPSEYSHIFDDQQSAIEGSTAFVKQMCRDGWIPVAIVINGVIYIPGEMPETGPFSLN